MRREERRRGRVRGEEDRVGSEEKRLTGRRPLYFESSVRPSTNLADLIDEKESKVERSANRPSSPIQS